MLTIALLFSMLFASAMSSGTLVVVIGNVEHAEGRLMVALYEDPARWLDDDGRAREFVLPIEEGATDCRIGIENLPFGTYALAVFHDENGNGVLDTNLFGVPTEPYAFSNNPDLKWRQPKYEDAGFAFARDGQEILLLLAKWKER